MNVTQSDYNTWSYIGDDIKLLCLTLYYLVSVLFTVESIQYNLVSE